MTMQNYMDIARGEGYDVKYTGVGMAYVTCKTSALTDVMNADEAEAHLALIGMAIINDDVRRMFRKG